MTEPAPDYAVIAPRVLRPAAVLRATARDAAVGAMHGGEAWETFAAREFIPLEWVTGRQRVFGSGKQRFVPQSVADAVTFASDVRGVLAAEALAREAEARLVPWTGLRERRIVWRVRKPDAIARMRAGMRSIDLEPERAGWDALATMPASQLEPLPAPPSPPRGVLRRMLDALLGVAPPRPPRRANVRHARIDEDIAPLSAALARSVPPAPGIVPWVLRDARNERVWAHLAAAGLRVPAAFRYGQGEVPERVRGVPFAELPNPFTPLVALWGTGYVLRAIEHDAIRLLAAEPPDAVPPRPEMVSQGIYR